MHAALLALLFLLAASLIDAVRAQTFCAVANDGSTNCSFTSAALCRDDVKGKGGFCIPQAPVGHRQPRAADLPRNVPPDPFDLRLQQENRKLDRDLRLCRGC
ncbi:MAG TPA: hypothetical protein VIU42_14515 [Xanthobacteraceae bacterium]|jgi:hypothetical protein